MEAHAVLALLKSSGPFHNRPSIMFCGLFHNRPSILFWKMLYGQKIILLFKRIFWPFTKHDASRGDLCGEGNFSTEVVFRRGMSAIYCSLSTMTDNKTHWIHPHEELPAVHIRDVNEMKQLLGPDTVGDILHVSKTIHYSALLRAKQNAVEVCIHYCGA